MTNKPKGMGLGIALGAALGAALGVAAGHLAIWLAIGVAIGIAIGGSVRRKGIDCPQCAEIHRAHEVGDERQQARS
jgi:RsiW-degrading membrane proteinase PrsW (M82 family)